MLPFLRISPQLLPLRFKALPAASPESHGKPIRGFNRGNHKGFLKLSGQRVTKFVVTWPNTDSVLHCLTIRFEPRVHACPCEVTKSQFTGGACACAVAGERHPNCKRSFLALPGTWKKALTSRLEAIALRLEAIATRLKAIVSRWRPSLLGWRPSLLG